MRLQNEEIQLHAQEITKLKLDLEEQRKSQIAISSILETIMRKIPPQRNPRKAETDLTAVDELKKVTREIAFLVSRNVFLIILFCNVAQSTIILDW